LIKPKPENPKPEPSFRIKPESLKLRTPKSQSVPKPAEAGQIDYNSDSANQTAVYHSHSAAAR